MKSIIEQLNDLNCLGLARVRSATGAELCSMRTGGEVTLVEPNSFEDLAELVRRFRAHGLKFRLLGAGSNVLIPDAGLSEPVLRLGREFARWCFGRDFLCSSSDQLPKGDPRITALGGAALMGLSRSLSKLGFGGLEFAAGIPASLGGALRMNAGAHGEAIGQLLESALVLTASGDLHERSQAELGFAYRHSALGSEEIVVAAVLALVPGDAQAISARRAECLEYRRRTQPLQYPSFGSVFRNPSKTTHPSSGAPVEAQLPAAAELLERAGLKGYARGGAMFSTQHANWIVKIRDDATTSDVVSLIAEAQDRVQQSCGITLIPEVVIW